VRGQIDRRVARTRSKCVESGRQSVAWALQSWHRRRNIMRTTLLVLVILAATAYGERSSHAVTCTSPGQVVYAGQPNDIVFTYGVASTQYINASAYSIAGNTDSDCQGYARSNVTGVSIGAIYGPGVCPAPLVAPGQWALVDQSRNNTSNELGPVHDSCNDPDGRIPVVYDGVSAAAFGVIDLARAPGEFSEPEIVAKVNVWIVNGTPPAHGFTVTTNIGNHVAPDRVRIDHPLLAGNSVARVFVQHFSESNTPWNHPIAAAYVGGQWHVRSEDGTAIPTGLKFNVRVDPTALRLQTPGSNPSYALLIDHPAANGNPFAVIVASPFSTGNRRMTHPFGVMYWAPRWYVIFTDLADMPTTSITCSGWPFQCTSSYAGFNVKILGAGQYVDDTIFGDPSGIVDTQLANGAGTDIRDTSRHYNNYKIVNSWCWTTGGGAPSQVLFSTFNVTPLPAQGYASSLQPRFFGIGRHPSQSPTVFTEDGAQMEGFTPLNVWGLYRPDCPPGPSS
jgi:hypothetical protein